MRSIFQRIMIFVEPVAWTVAGGVATGTASYLQAANDPSLSGLWLAIVVGAGTAFTAYMRKPRHTE
jgi:O-antigen/teichoic acid export membrane protein